MKVVALAVLTAIFVAFSGCLPMPAVESTPAQARALSRGAVETAESAWLLAANGCVDTAAMVNDKSLVEKCGAVLLPARVALHAAAVDVDAWEADSSQSGLAGDVACELAKVSKALDAVASLGVKLPPLVVSAQTLAGSLVCGSPSTGAKDGGSHE